MIKFPEVFDLSRLAVFDAVEDQGDVLIHVVLVHAVHPYQIIFMAIMDWRVCIVFYPHPDLSL